MDGVERKNFHGQVVDGLGQRIARGEFAPGVRMPTELVLARQFGVSRVVMREAIKSLAAKGMLSVRAGAGTRALARDDWRLLDPDVLNWLAQTDLDSPFLSDLIELRRIIEPPAARLASERATHRDLAAIRESYRLMAVAVDEGRGYDAADLQFHAAILSACHNQFLRQMQAPLSQLLKLSFSFSSRHPLTGTGSLGLHEAVLLAIEQRDGKAASSAMETLIRHANEHMRSVVARVGPGQGKRRRTFVIKPSRRIGRPS
jgi:GntR family transcriptional regulator, galactonate operon transcriptional repressor